MRSAPRYVTYMSVCFVPSAATRECSWEFEFFSPLPAISGLQNIVGFLFAIGFDLGESSTVRYCSVQRTDAFPSLPWP